MIDIDQNVNFSQSGCALNSQGFSICIESGTFSGPNLNAGTYWLNLQNAMVSNGDAVYFIWPYDAQPVLLKNSTTSRPQRRNADNPSNWITSE